MTLQQILVGIVMASAIVFLIRRFHRVLGDDKKEGCEKCEPDNFRENK